jgi:UDP-N-acetylglucosamine acyltransferase
MSKSNIHPTAIVEHGAEIGQNVTIEAYAVVKSTVTLKDNVTIKSFAYIDGNTTIGKGTVIWPSASIGTKTQDLKFQGENTYVVIGENCEIREFVTINSSCHEGSTVRVGDNCLIMAYCHLAHNCEVGNNVIMANGAMLAGHVIVEDYAVIGGMTPIHQFCRVGRNAMVGGLSRVTHDIPPYTIGAGSLYKVGGLNLIGLKRRGFSFEERKAIYQAFKLTYRSGLTLSESLDMIEQKVSSNEHVAHWLDFCRTSKRGLIGLSASEVSLQEEEENEFEQVLQEKN